MNIIYCLIFPTYRRHRPENLTNPVLVSDDVNYFSYNSRWSYSIPILKNSITSVFRLNLYRSVVQSIIVWQTAESFQQASQNRNAHDCFDKNNIL